MNKKTWVLVLAAVLLLAGMIAAVLLGQHGAAPAQTPQSAEEAAASSGAVPETPTSDAAETAHAETTQAETAITLSGDQITVDGPGAMVSGTTVTVGQAGSYRISGTLNDGQILVDADREGEVRLILDGANITYRAGAPICVMQAGITYLETAAGTENSVTDTAEYVFAEGEDEPDAAIFSKDDLCLMGEGTLTVAGNYSMAIHGKDTVSLNGTGTYELTAVGDGLKGKDQVLVDQCTLRITAGEDGIDANNSKDDAMGTVSLNADVTIQAGKHGVKAESGLAVLGGSLNITAVEDGLHSNSYTLEIQDGTVTVDAQQDGVQGANLDISGGALHIVAGGGAANAPEHQEGFGFPGWFDTDTTEETVSAKGLKSDGDLTVSGGILELDCMDDALHCGGTLTVSGDADLTVATGDDGLHADDTLDISGGKINITKSYEGLEAVHIQISGGDTALVASDDGLNAAGGTSADTDFAFMGPPGGEGTAETLEDATYYVHITGGKLTVDAGGDGLDSNGALFVDDGEVYVSGPSNSMNGGLDYTTTGQVNGGTVVIAGASGMAQNFDTSSTQASLMYGFSSQIEAGSTVTLTDGAGAVLVETTMAKPFHNVVISLPELTVGQTYTLTCGTETAEVTLSGTITFLGTGGFGGPGGGPGGMRPR